MRPRPPRRPFYLPVWYYATAEERRATSANTYVGADGMTILLEDGTALEDWSGQVFVNNIGLGRPDIAKALADQALRLSFLSPGDFADVRLALTEDLRTVLPRHLTTPFYGIGGSDSIEAAVRAAWKVTRRRKVLAFRHGYHGDTISVESVSGWGNMEYGDARRWAVHSLSPYDAFQEEGDWERAMERTHDGIVKALRRHGPRSFACILVEPIMGVAGVAPLSRDLSGALRELCDRHGIKLVADEVITGFGRTGEWFGSQAVGLTPDAMVFAKGLTGGYAPLGAVVFERSWGATLRRTGFPHGLTFGGHPLGCTAARQTIRILKAEGLVERAKVTGAYLKDRLEEIRADRPRVVRDVRGRGLLLAMELRGRGRRPKEGPHPAWKRVEPIWTGLRKEGVRLGVNNDGSSLLFCPPFTVTHEQIDRLVERLAARMRTA